MFNKNFNMNPLRLWDYLKQRKFFRNVFLLVSGTALAQMFAALASPVLTRLYSPNEFGMLSVYISMLSLLSLFGTLQYENAITIPKEDSEAADLLVLSFIILLIVSISTMCFSVVSLPLLKLLQCLELKKYIWLIPLSLFGVGTYNILNRWNMRRKTFGLIAKTKITQSVGMVFTQITFGFLKQGPLGLLIGDVIGRIGGSGRLTWLILKEDRKLLFKVSKKSLHLAAVRFSKFPLMSSWSVLLKELADQLPAFFFTVTYGPTVVGWFMLVQRILGMPLSIIGYSVGNVFISEVSTLSQQKSTEQIFKLYWRTLKSLMLISLPFMLLVSIVSPWAFPLLFGPKWNEAGIYLQILSPMYLLQFLSIPVSNTVSILERQNLQLIRELIRFCMLLIAFLVVKDANLTALESIKLLSVIGSISFVVNVIISWLAIKPIDKVETISG